MESCKECGHWRRKGIGFSVGKCILDGIIKNGSSETCYNFSQKKKHIKDCNNCTHCGSCIIDQCYIPTGTCVYFVKSEDSQSRTENKADKFDDEKLRWDLLPYSTIEEVVKIYTFGAKKYGDNNWRKGLKYSRVIAAIMRHFTAFIKGEDYDKESGLLHLAHVMWGIITLIEYCKWGNKVLDDRIYKVSDKDKPPFT